MKHVFPFLICALFTSCFNEGDCLVTATNMVRIQFKKKKNNSEDTVVLFSYYTAGQQDTVNTSQILLPLNVSQDSTFTTFKLLKLNADSTEYGIHTLKISYDKQAKVITKDCGAYTYYKNLKVTKSRLLNDSLPIKTFSTSLLKNPTGSSTDFTSYALNFQILY